MEAKVGTLTPGKEADIVMLRTDLPNTLPFNNAYGAIVTAMDTSNVDTVMIAGKVVKRAGKLVGVDLDRVRTRGGRLARLSRRQARMAALGDRYELVRALAHDPEQGSPVFGKDRAQGHARTAIRFDRIGSWRNAF